MFRLETKAPVFFLLCVFAIAQAAADSPSGQDRDRPFRKGRGGFRGNERSERPGHVVPGKLSYGGNGCPAGTMRVAFAPDNLSFTMLFDSFIADTSDGARRDAMSCDALLPITIPEGQQMEITRVDYRGFANVPAKGKGVLRSVFNFAGRGANRDRISLRFRFDGPVSENYEISSGDMGNGRALPQTEVSPCGGEAHLRLHNEVKVTAPRGQQAQLTVDSIDGSSNAVYYVSWSACRRTGTARR
jgi:hypothetical protein